VYPVIVYICIVPISLKYRHQHYARHSPDSKAPAAALIASAACLDISVQPDPYSVNPILRAPAEPGLQAKQAADAEAPAQCEPERGLRRLGLGLRVNKEGGELTRLTQKTKVSQIKSSLEW
jgi:hypothetical protein